MRYSTTIDCNGEEGKLDSCYLIENAIVHYHESKLRDGKQSIVYIAIALIKNDRSCLFTS